LNQKIILVDGDLQIPENRKAGQGLKKMIPKTGSF
jgi:hypothetical protein